MIKFLINRPIGILMSYVALLILGMLSYETLPISLMPDIPIPEVIVKVNYQSNSARELENAIIKPLRLQLMQVEHLVDIKSETRNGQSFIYLKFEYGTNIDYAFIETNEKIDASMNTLPGDMERPKVIKFSATDIPVFYLNLTLKDSSPLVDKGSGDASTKFMELSDFAESVIRKRIEQLPEIALVDISGTLNGQLSIKLNQQLMHTLQLSLADFEEVLQRNNISLSGISVRNGTYEYNIHFKNELRTKEDVEGIYLKLNGKILQLKEIANVSFEPRKQEGMFMANNKPAITMALIKQSSARLGNMRNQIHQLTKTFENEYPEILFEISQDQTELLNYSISNLKQNLIQGLLLVTIVVFFFLKDFKKPILIGLTLIISVVICMLFFRFFNLSINIISLSGLILAIGNMIDNSIVITDNISQYQEKGVGIENACIKGTNEVIVPMLSSMLTNISVFIPLLLISGIGGALLFDEAISVTIGLLVSYLVAITLMPVLFKLFDSIPLPLPVKNLKLLNMDFIKNIKLERNQHSIEKMYEKGLEFVFYNKGITLLIVFLIIPLTIFLFYHIKREKIPAFRQSEVLVDIDWNENIGVEENKKRVTAIFQVLNAPLKELNFYIGHQDFLMKQDKNLSITDAQIYLKANGYSDLVAIKGKLENYLTNNYPNSKFSFNPPVSIFEKIFTSGAPPLIAEVKTLNKKNYLNKEELNEILEELNRSKVLSSNNQIPFKDNIIISFNLEKLLIYKIEYEVLFSQLKAAFSESTITTLRSFQKYIPVVIKGEERLISEIINDMSVYNKDNILVPVNSLISINKISELKTITAGKNGEYVPLYFFPESKDENTFLNEISSSVKSVKNIGVSFSGSLAESRKFLKELSFVLLISILLLYFILAAQFESLVQPLIILLELPIDIGGALIMLVAFNQSLNIMSAIGIVIMCGIVINDSILKIDIINQLRKESGLPLFEVIKIGGIRRLRAILMTSLTSILAMIPLLFGDDMGSELQKPFSIALIGGMIFGTAVSLFVVPLFYWFIYRNENRYNIKT